MIPSFTHPQAILVDLAYDFLQKVMIHRATFWAMFPSIDHQMRHRAHDRSKVQKSLGKIV